MLQQFVCKQIKNSQLFYMFRNQSLSKPYHH